ncbi:MAG: hypothetical protein LBQ20_05650 [Rhodanobacter sp.]|jgi:hypothetical protein|nr:hypothetical protein [Rhodanobacter sp.]
MSGKFLSGYALRNTKKALEAVNARQKRAGTNFAVSTVPCGCSDPECGAFHRIETDRPLPTTEEAIQTLKAKKAAGKMEPVPNIAFNPDGFAAG